MGPDDILDNEQDKGTTAPADIKDLEENFNNQDEEDLYNPVGPQKTSKNRFSGILKNRKAMGGLAGGGIIGLILIIMASLSGFLNTFQLDHLMSNIEQRAMGRNQAALSSRSDAWIRAYMRARLTEINDKPGSTAGNSKEDPLLFKASVDTDNPFRDWYRTLRSSNFEQDVFENNGITFVSAVYKDSNDVVHVGVGKIKFAGSTDVVMSSEEVSALRDAVKSGGSFNKFSDLLDKQFTVEIFDNTKDARKAVRGMVKDNTHWWQVIKRRHVRLDIQNRTGITNWKFFEKTRDKVSTKVQDVRNKFIKAALPDNTKVGLIVQCLFGIIKDTKQCSGGEDAADPKDNADTLMTESDPNATTDSTTHDLHETYVDPTTGATKEATLVANGVTVKFLQDVIEKFGGVLNASNWVSTIDTITNAIDNLSKIKGMVVAYKAAQAMMVYATLNTMRDQIKAGDVTAPEVSANMSMLNNMGDNEGYSTVIDEQSASAKADSNSLVNAKSKEEYCSNSYQEKLKDPSNASQVNNVYHYLCPEKQIGGLSGVTSGIDAFFSSPEGTALKNVANAWKTVTNNVFVNFLRTVGNGVSFIVSPFIRTLLSATGLGPQIDKVIQYMMGKVAELAGIKPLIDSSSDGSTPIITGQVINAAVQGGAATAEDSMRSGGAAKTTSQTQALSDQLVAKYNSQQSSSESTLDRYASISSPNSFISNLLFSFSQNKFNVVSALRGFVSKLANMFNPGQYAFAAPSPYDAANFAGIETYDYPQQCYDMDPLTMTPQNSTNLQAVLSQNNINVQDSELTWDVVSDSSAFYKFLYDKLDSNPSITDPDKIAVQIYNCELLDNNVRGGLGALYGYTKDHGLEAAASSNAAPSSSTTNNTVYVLGDSLTYGMDNTYKVLSPKLTASGWTSTINGLGSRQMTISSGSINSGLDQAQKDKDTISQVGSIVIELGTNGCDESSQTFTSQMSQLYNYMKSINSSAKYYWVNYYFAGDVVGGVDRSCKAADTLLRNSDLSTFAQNNSITIIDWDSIASSYVKPGVSMGVHPATIDGYDAMAQKIVGTLGPATN